MAVCGGFGMSIPNLSSMSLLPTKGGGTAAMNAAPRQISVKRGRDQAFGGIDIREGVALADSINEYGCAAIPLKLPGEDEFVAAVDNGTSEWFLSHMQSYFESDEVPTYSTKTDAEGRKLSKPVPDTQKNEEWTRGREVYKKSLAILGVHNNGNLINTSVLEAVDPGTETGRYNLFDSDRRKKALLSAANTVVKLTNWYDGGNVDDDTKVLGFYLNEGAKYVKQGDSKMALGSLVKAWAGSGFGKWAHIVTAQGLRAMRLLQVALEEEGIVTVASGLPHLIYKPPSGEELTTHTDQIQPEQLPLRILEMRDRMNGVWPTSMQWAKEQGMQSLVHHKGGSFDGTGATYIIGPMTPQRLCVCMQAVFAKGRVNNADELALPTDHELFGKTKLFSNFKTEKGPAFMNWKNNLQFFNGALVAAGLEGNLAVIPIRANGADGPIAGAFAALWPVGFPHGSEMNTHRRITTTAPLSLGKTIPDPRNEKRLNALATLATNGLAPEVYAEAENVIDSEKGQFADGKTHKNPQWAANWIRSEDAARQRVTAPGPYRHIAPTMETIGALNWSG